MKYPNLDKIAVKKASRKSQINALCKAYANADSYAEFKVNSDVLGIGLIDTFLFWTYYVYKNNGGDKFKKKLAITIGAMFFVACLSSGLLIEYPKTNTEWFACIALCLLISILLTAVSIACFTSMVKTVDDAISNTANLYAKGFH